MSNFIEINSFVNEYSKFSFDLNLDIKIGSNFLPFYVFFDGLGDLKQAAWQRHGLTNKILTFFFFFLVTDRKTKPQKETKNYCEWLNV